MTDGGKTREQLLAEVAGLQRELTALRRSSAGVTTQALIESEHLLRESQAAARIGSYETDFVAGVWKSSAVLDRIFGIDADYPRTISGWLELVHPAMRREMSDYLEQEVLGRGRRFVKDYRIVRRNDGQERWVLGLGELRFDPHGRPIRMVGTIQDITDRKQVEEKLFRLNLAIGQMADGVAIAELDGTVQFANPAWAEMHGYQVDEIIGKNLTLFHTPEQLRDEVMPFNAQMMLRGFRRGEVGHVHRAGTVFSTLMTSTLIRDGSGNPLCMIGTARDISERKRIETALRESEEFNREIIASAGEGIVVYDRDLRYLVWNRFMEEMTGITAAQVIGQPALGQFPRLREQGIHRLLERALAGETCAAREFDFAVPASGKSGWASAIYHPHRNAGGEIIGVVGMVRDITEQKRVALAQQESNERYRSLIATTETGFVIVSAEDGTVLDANQVYVELTGHRKLDEICGRSVLEWTAPYDRERNAAEVKKCFATGRVRNLVIDYRHADGKIVPIEINADVLVTDRGRIIQTLCRDITARKRAEDELHFKNALLAAELEASPFGILVVNEQGRTLFANRRFAELWRIPEDILRTNNDDNMIAFVVGQLADPEAFIAKVRHLYAHRQESSQDEIRFKDGRTFARYSLPMTVAGGSYAGRVWHFEDITERQRAEAALRASEAGLERAQAQAQLGSWEHDFATQRSYWSKEMFRLLGRDPAAGVPNLAEYLALLSPECRPRVEAANRRALATGAAVQTEVSVLSAPGPPRYFIDTVECERNERGEPRRMFGTLLEITERKRAEQELAASLHEKEVLLREIHHRVKNNMQIISSMLRLQSRTSKDPETLAVFNDSQNRIAAMALVHEKLYQSADLATVDLRAYLSGLISGLKRSYATAAVGIEVELKIEQVSLAIDRAIPCGLIINELLANAFKHAFPGGRRGKVNLELAIADADQVRLTVRDDGVGVPEGFVLRESPSLGLHLAAILVEEQLHGTLTVTRDRGTVFTIVFRRE